MSSGSLRVATSETGRGRAFRPGPRSAFAGAAVVAIVIAAIVVIALGSGGKSSAQAAAHRYGHLPSWLPKISNGAQQLEVARPASPVLREEQGYTVRAELPGGATNITAAGPEVPSWVASDVQTGTWPDGKPVPGKFIVTVIDAKGTVPVVASAFTILTDAGVIVHPKVTLVGGGPLPAALHPGQHVNVVVSGAVTEGSGSIRWAPLGRKVLVGWIYQLELD
jgi:hypothetical protein